MSSLIITKKTRPVDYTGPRHQADAGIGICRHCRGEVTLTSPINACRCGRLYTAWGTSTVCVTADPLDAIVPPTPRSPALVRAAEIVKARRAAAQGSIFV